MLGRSPRNTQNARRGQWNMSANSTIFGMSLPAINTSVFQAKCWGSPHRIHTHTEQRCYPCPHARVNSSSDTSHCFVALTAGLSLHCLHFVKLFSFVWCRDADKSSLSNLHPATSSPNSNIKWKESNSIFSAAVFYKASFCYGKLRSNTRNTCI